MEKKSIADLKQLFVSGDISDEYVTNLKSDERKGVQALIKSFESKKRREQELEEKFINMCYYEKKCYQNGCNYIAGIDEAGRGPLAGPVVAAAVILPRDFKLLGLDDSKQLNEATRNKFYDIIKNESVSYGISIISNQQIDQLNIFESTKLAMRDCLNQLDPKPEHVLIDAVHLDELPCTYEAITKGDQKSITIAAASILAKVTRDRLMKDIHNKFPAYDFASNMGYGTKHHMEMLDLHGVTPYHRRSFAPIRDIVK
ncbi:ribonuclease HII [Virgibacillus ndiopensis]|uniref:ribonuclease HII n=1 Tax=Virgibacillus ndiopensis TaxID=2004408 RepID=UPI000C0881EE|nr:ribonuclease HII [Virgibacillus ndiopensis]